MKVGDYVRTYDGVIGKIIDDNFAQEEKRYELDYNNKLYYFQQIVKSSQNIIDLIEVGDYVNGRKVYQVGYNFQDDLVLKMSINADGTPNNFEDFIYEKDIKSVVTKEQFSSMEYKVN